MPDENRKKLPSRLHRFDSETWKCAQKTHFETKSSYDCREVLVLTDVQDFGSRASYKKYLNLKLRNHCFDMPASKTSIRKGQVLFPNNFHETSGRLYNGISRMFYGTTFS